MTFNGNFGLFFVVKENSRVLKRVQLFHVEAFKRISEAGVRRQEFKGLSPGVSYHTVFHIPQSRNSFALFINGRVIKTCSELTLLQAISMNASGFTMHGL